MVKFAQQFVCCRLFELLEEVRVVTLRKSPRISVGMLFLFHSFYVTQKLYCLRHFCRLCLFVRNRFLSSVPWRHGILCTARYLSFHPMNQCVEHVLKGMVYHVRPFRARLSHKIRNIF